MEKTLTGSTQAVLVSDILRYFNANEYSFSLSRDEFVALDTCGGSRFPNANSLGHPVNKHQLKIGLKGSVSVRV